MIYKYPSSSKMTLFCSIIVYVLYIIKKLKSQKNNYHKYTNKIRYLEAPLLIKIIRRKKAFIHQHILNVFERLDKQNDILCTRYTRQKLCLREQKSGTTN